MFKLYKDTKNTYLNAKKRGGAPNIHDIVKSKLESLQNSNTAEERQRRIIDIVKLPFWKTYSTTSVDTQVKCKSLENTTRDVVMISKASQSRQIFTDLYDDTDKNNERYYTFIISNKGVKYGKIRDGLEFGAQHMHLYEPLEQALVGGEIKIEGTHLFFNFSSGLITKTLRAEHLEYFESHRPLLIVIATTIFGLPPTVNSEGKTLITTVTYVPGVLLPKSYPSLDEVAYICKNHPYDLLVVDGNGNCPENVVRDEDTRNLFCRNIDALASMQQ